MQNRQIRNLIVSFVKVALCCLYCMLTICHQRPNFSSPYLLISHDSYLALTDDNQSLLKRKSNYQLQLIDKWPKKIK